MKFDTSIRTKKYFANKKNTKRYVMLHHTASSAADVNQARYLGLNRAPVSCHYVVGRDGHIRQLADHNKCTWHAGTGSWEGKRNLMNYDAIGIEVCSNGKSFTLAQLKATTELVKYIMEQENIPAVNVIRHKDYSPGRKWDIGDNFRYPQFKKWEDYQQSLAVVHEAEMSRDEKILQYLEKKGVFNGDLAGNITREHAALMVGRTHFLGVDDIPEV